MEKEIIKQRAKIVRAKLKDQKLDGLLICKPANVSYITGFSGEDSWALISKSASYLLTDSRYIEQARTECLDSRQIERKGRMSEAISQLLRSLKSVRKLGVENEISIGAYKQLEEKLEVQLEPTENVVEDVRQIKIPEEVGLIKSAARIAAEAFKAVHEHLRPGISEMEFAGLLDLEIRRRGAVNSFDTIVCFGPSGSRPHHRPGGNKLGKNDSFLIDFGARYKGYCSDITRSGFVGVVSPRFEEVYAVVDNAQRAAIAKVKAGVSAAEVDAAARKIIGKTNFPMYGHGTGHGLGMEVHEGPVVSPKASCKLLAGQVVTIEPGIYLPGKFGVRIEDDVLVTEHGCEVLTSRCVRDVSVNLGNM